MRQVIFIVIVFFLFLFLYFLCWKVDRWINWRFDYGGRVEDRIEKLEERVSALEKAYEDNNGR